MSQYPTEQTLKFIREFDVNNPLKEVLDLLESEWAYADVGYFNLKIKKDKVYLELHTAGWSGNENLYDAFVRIEWINLFWKKSEKGGHYYYEFPREIYDKRLSKEGKYKEVK